MVGVLCTCTPLWVSQVDYRVGCWSEGNDVLQCCLENGDKQRTLLSVTLRELCGGGGVVLKSVFG